MPFEITNQGDYFLVRLHGVVTAADLVRLGSEAEVVEDAQPEAMDRITDLTNVDAFDFGFPEVLALAERRKARVFSKPVKSALIARELVPIGLARMFQTLNTNPMIEIRILGSVQEAKDWFGAIGSGASA